MQQDNIRWVAQYNDGTELHQIEKDGTKNAYEDIDRSKLASFLLHVNFKPLFGISFDGDGKSLVWRRRVQTSSEGERKVHIIGKKNRFIAVVNEDMTLIVDNFDDNNALLTTPEYLEVEGE